ncbi:MAG: polyphenol oxidase family protein [Firmicutes bacterium]|nr:polyphenol oxidase family protein [Bacillota bacterium]
MRDERTAEAPAWRWRRRGDLVLLEANIGPAHLVFTSRAGGVSPPPFDSLNLGRSVPDAPENVEENLRRLFAALGIERERVATAHQVHGREVAVVGEPTPAGAAPVRADALVTRRRDAVLMLRFADCVPVFLVAPEAGAIGIAHAGWRGLAAGVVGAAVTAMRTSLGAAGADLWAAVGPCAGPTYQVDEPVMAALRPTLPWADRYRDGRGMLDLAGVTRHALADAGVGHDRVLVAAERTDSPAFFSHRASGGRTGRMAGLIRMVDSAV